MIRTMVAFVTLIGLLGCAGGVSSKPLPRTEPVTGTVMLDNDPLEGALVTFVPSESTAGVECSGRTDSDGNFTPIQPGGAEGVPVGQYRVVVSRFLRNGEPVDPAAPTEDGAGILTESIPMKYSSPSATTLKAEVKEGGDQFEFKLSSK